MRYDNDTILRKNIICPFSENRQYNGQKKMTSKTLHRQLSKTNANKTEGGLRCSGRVSSSCSDSGTPHVILITNTVISHESKINTMLCTSHSSNKNFSQNGISSIKNVLPDYAMSWRLLKISFGWNKFIYSTVLLINWKTKNTTLCKQFKNPTEKW